MKEAFEKLIAGRNLDRSEMERCFGLIMSGQVNDVQIGGFLRRCASREDPAEIETAARVMRSHAVPVDTGCDVVVDTCGTGGDGASTFNISTAAAFVMAGAGYHVAKHGNRSVSSSSGSADCLEALGVPITLGPEDAARAVREKGFCFLFAPAYHPSMKYAMPARKQLGIRTVFNTLGPLANPAGPRTGHRRVRGVARGTHLRGAHAHGDQGGHGGAQRARRGIRVRAHPLRQARRRCHHHRRDQARRRGAPDHGRG
jgi:anthranilate phosphoribosyltransferase